MAQRKVPIKKERKLPLHAAGGALVVEAIPYWMEHYDRIAKKQGWSLFVRDDGDIELVKIDEPEPGDAELTTDQDAMNIAIKQALEGDIMSLYAIYLDGRVAFEKTHVIGGKHHYATIDIPRNMQEEFRQENRLKRPGRGVTQ